MSTPSPKIIPFPKAPAEQQRQSVTPRGFLTKKDIETATPPAAGEPPKYLRCPMIRGFGVYITSQDVRTYYYEARVRGEKNKTRVTYAKVGSVDFKDAQSWARDLSAKARNGEQISKRAQDAIANPPAGLTLTEAYRLYKADQTSTKRERPWAPSTLDKYEQMMERLSAWQAREFFSLTKAEVSARFIEIREEFGPTAARQVFTNFGAMWNFHAADVEPSPVSPTKVLATKDLWPKLKPVTRVVEAEQFPAWWRSLDGINPSWALYFRALAILGCRKMELLKAEWSWYDAKRRELTLPGPITKARREVTLPVGPYLAAMLEAQRKSQEEGVRFIFAKPSGRRFSHPDSTVRQHIVVNKQRWSPHDLRRVFATVAHDNGVPLKAIKLLMNHSTTGDVTLGYIQPEELRGHQERIEAAILKRAKVRS